jgi:hypothetical protein
LAAAEERSFNLIYDSRGPGIFCLCFVVRRVHDKNLQKSLKAWFFRDLISSNIDIIAVTTAKPAQLFEKIGQIQRMERGKLTVMREGPEGPYYKHQAWENGKNVSRYVPCDQAPAVQQAIQGYQKFQELTEQYAQAVIDKTRAELAAHSKKKKYHLRRKSSSPKIRKSGS